MKKSKLMMFVFLTPAVLLYLLVFLYPTVRTAVMSFFRVESISDAVSGWLFVGVDNFRQLFSSKLFMRSMANIGKIWLWGGLGVFFLSLLFAVILTSGIKYKSFFRAAIYLPNVISAVAMGTMWMQYVYSAKYGLFKQVFTFFKFETLAKTQWTAPENIFTSLLVAYSFGMVGYFMLIFMAGIEKIPTDFYEAASLEGAGKFLQFKNITVPLIKGIFRTNIVLWSISIVGFFVWSQIFSPLNPEPGTVTPMVYMYQLVFGANMVVSDRNAGAGAAVGVLLTAGVIIVFALANILIKDDDYEF